MPRSPSRFPLGLAGGIIVAGLALSPPVHAAALREMSTDRPDATESPFTVDAGHTQLEMDALAFTHDRFAGVRATELSLAPFNLRFGVTPNFELGIFFSPFVRATEEPRGGPKATLRGRGDVTLRAKLNFRGNDGGGTATGMIVDVKLPTAKRGLGNDRVEGALTFPVAFELGGGWEGGAMTSLGALYDGSRHRATWGNTLTVAHGLVREVGVFFEVTSQAGVGAHVCTFDTGLTWQINRDLQLDAGVYLGLSRSAPDATWFAGISRRF